MTREAIENQTFESGRSSWGTLRPNPISTVLFVGLTLAGVGAVLMLRNLPLGLAMFVLAVLALLSLKIAAQWERVLILRLGKFSNMKGPGLFFIMPFMDTIPY